MAALIFLPRHNLYAQAGTIDWPTACPTNSCPGTYTDPNGLQLTVRTTYGTGSGNPVGNVELIGETAMNYALTASLSSDAPGLSILHDYGRADFTTADTDGNLYSFVFDRPVDGVSFPIYDITSPVLACDVPTGSSGIYNDQVSVTGVDESGNAVAATLTQLAAGHTDSGLNYAQGDYAFSTQEVRTIDGNLAYTLGGILNQDGTNIPAFNGNTFTGLDVTASFDVPVTEVRVNFANSSLGRYAWYSTGLACSAINTQGNGNVQPQGIFLGNLTYTDIIPLPEICCNGIDDDMDGEIDEADACGGDKDTDGIADLCDLDDDNDGIPDRGEQECTLGQQWVPAGVGVYESTVGPNLKVRVTLGNFSQFWDAPAPSNVSFGRLCTAFTSQFGTIADVGNNGLRITSGNGSGSATAGTLTVSYLDLSNNPVEVVEPVFHLAGLGGSNFNRITSSQWTGSDVDIEFLSSDDITIRDNGFIHARATQNNGRTIDNCPTGEGAGTIRVLGTVSSFTFAIAQRDASGNLGNTGNFTAADQFDLLFENCIQVFSDGDPLADDCDTDADGDGCPDAIEAGNPAITIGNQATTIDASGMLTDAINANGIPNVADPNEDGTIDYPLSGAFSDSAVNLCADKDSDGIADFFDLDDDNDGIPDEVECSTARSYDVYFYSRTANGWATAVPVTVTGATTVNTIVNQTASYSDYAFGGRQFLQLASDISPATDGTLTVEASAEPSAGGAFVLVNAILLVDADGTETLLTNGDAGYSDVGSWQTSTNSNNGGFFGGGSRFVSSGNYGGNDIATFAFDGLQAGGNCDPDNDGLTNDCDGDSDGDGCPDIIESGLVGRGSSLVGYTLGDTTFDITMNAVGANGLLDAVETGAESGMTATLASEDGVLDDFLNAAFQSADCEPPVEICCNGIDDDMDGTIDNVDECGGDKDMDGVPDFCDLDDDNDGIPDAVEIDDTDEIGVDFGFSTTNYPNGSRTASLLGQNGITYGFNFVGGNVSNGFPQETGELCE